MATNMLPATTARVPQFTQPTLNEQLQRQTQQNVEQAANSSPQTIDRRLCELDEEWDVDRAIAATTATATVIGIVLTIAVDFWFLLLPALADLSLLLYAVIGWCPLLSPFRSFGFRTSTEIDYERYAIKALRGDFQPLAGVITPEDREAIATLEGEGGIVAEAPSPAAGDPEVVQAAMQAAQK